MRSRAAVTSAHFRALPAILAITAAVLGIGCNDTPGRRFVVCADGCGIEQTPQSVLENLTKAWTVFDYDAYRSLLSDDFTFVFAPLDTGDPPPPPWGRADELLSASHLFSKTYANRDGYIAQSASVSFAIGPEIPNDMNGWTKIVLSEVFLTVRTRNKDTGDPFDYVVRGEEAILWFADEGGKWRIVRWEDNPIPTGLHTQQASWGEIKGSFR